MVSKDKIQGGKFLEGPRRGGHRVERRVVAITPHPGYATMVRFVETFLAEKAPEREITLKSFSGWAVREVGVQGK